MLFAFFCSFSFYHCIVFRTRTGSQKCTVQYFKKNKHNKEFPQILQQSICLYSRPKLRCGSWHSQFPSQNWVFMFGFSKFNIILHFSHIYFSDIFSFGFVQDKFQMLSSKRVAMSKHLFNQKLNSNLWRFFEIMERACFPPSGSMKHLWVA